MEAAQVSLLRWLRRQLRQPIPAREHLEAAVENDDVAEARRLLAGFEFTDEQAPGLGDVVVLDGCLEMLPHRDRLPQLPSQPAEEAHLRRFHGLLGERLLVDRDHGGPMLSAYVDEYAPVIEAFATPSSATGWSRVAAGLGCLSVALLGASLRWAHH